jgi:hypothetical protein
LRFCAFPDIEGVRSTLKEAKPVLDKVKEFSPVTDWKQIVGFFVLVILAVYVAKKLPLPGGFKP